MGRFSQALPVAPSGASVTINGTTVDATNLGRFVARAMGSAYQAPDDSIGQADPMAIGAHGEYLRTITNAIVAEAFLDSATYLLSELETMLGLAPQPGSSTTARRARLVARWRALRGGSPQAIETAVTGLLTAPDVAAVYETAMADIVNTSLDVFIFAVTVPLEYLSGDPGWMTLAQGIVDSAKPAHTRGNVTNKVGFRCDDDESLCDITVLSA